MPAPTVRLNLNVPPDLADALDAEARRSGRTKTEIVVAGLKTVLAKGAETMTTAEKLAAALNEYRAARPNGGGNFWDDVVEGFADHIDRDETKHANGGREHGDTIVLTDGHFVHFVTPDPRSRDPYRYGWEAR